MIRIVPATDNRDPNLVDLFVRSNDTPYEFRTVAEEKCYGAGHAGEPVHVLADEGGVLAGAAVVCGRYLRFLAVAPEQRRRGIGGRLLATVEEWLRERRETKAVVGGEPGNYFVPGVLRGDASAVGFFTRRGYHVTGEAVNLVAELTGRPVESPRAAGVVIARANEANRERALEFISREFGELWRFEVSHAFLDPAPPLFLASDGGELVGFSAHEVNNRGLGFYGPAGVRRDHRGGGIGAALLETSLNDLAARGYRRTVIPWVSSIPFYERVAGARVSEIFATMQKEL